jgi:cold shock CspA family protein
MATGTILWFDHGRGFGFIRPDLGPRDVFVHASALEGVPAEAVEAGAAVEFELVQAGDGRLVARRVLMKGLPGRNRRARDG